MAKIHTVAGGGPHDFVTARHIRVAGSNRHIGRVLAQAAHEVHGAVAGPVRAADPLVQKSRRRWFEANHPTLTERMLGIGDTFGIAADSDAWDLGMLGTYDVPAGCSTVFYPGETTKDGSSLLARNFDFPTITYTQLLSLASLDHERPLAADPWIVELHPEGGYSSVVIGIMDVLGGMDGINSEGLAVTLLADDESPNQEPSGRPQVGLSEQQIVRYLLDTCATVDEAKQALLMAKQYYVFVPCHFLIADAAGRAFVWEYSPGHNIEYIVDANTTPPKPLVCTNHLLHRWPDPNELPADDASGIAGRTYQRYRALDSHVTNGGLADNATAREQLTSVAFMAPDAGARTLWNSVYNLEARSVEVSFYLHDHAGQSRYTQPLPFSLN